MPLTGLRPRFLYYGAVWDAFFSQRKAGAPVIVRMANNSQIVGRIVSHSCRDEVREIRLRDYYVLRDKVVDIANAAPVLGVEVETTPALEHAGVVTLPNPFYGQHYTHRIHGELILGPENIHKISTPKSFLKKHGENLQLPTPLPRGAMSESMGRWTAVICSS